MIRIVVIAAVFLLAEGFFGARADEAKGRMGVIATIANEKGQITGHLVVGAIDDASSVEECTNYTNTSEDFAPMLRVLHLFGPNVHLECVAGPDKPPRKEMRKSPSVEADKHT